MSDFPDRRNEAGQDNVRWTEDIMDTEGSGLSTSVSNGRSEDELSAPDGEKNPMLTKVADLLDDITEIDQADASVAE
jgi:hypothetical protein